MKDAKTSLIGMGGFLLTMAGVGAKLYITKSGYPIDTSIIDQLTSAVGAVSLGLLGLSAADSKKE